MTKGPAMLDQFLILAEGSAEHGGISPYLVGLAAFVILMLLLGITYLFSGLNQSKRPTAAGEVARREHAARDHR